LRVEAGPISGDPAVFYHCHHWIGILCPLISDVDCVNISGIHHHAVQPACAMVRVEADINERNTGLFRLVTQLIHRIRPWTRHEVAAGRSA
jgi:hypothetical protein